MSDREDFFSGLYDHGDLESFKKYLTFEEMHRFENEEFSLKTAHLELLKKYNLIVADRMTRVALIEEVQGVLGSSSKELTMLLEELDNGVMQQFLSLIVLHKKQRNTLRESSYEASD